MKKLIYPACLVLVFACSKNDSETSNGDTTTIDTPDDVPLAVIRRVIIHQITIQRRHFTMLLICLMRTTPLFI